MANDQATEYYWRCSNCQTANSTAVARCRACGAPIPGGPQPQAAPAFDHSSPVQTRTYREATPDASAQRFAADAAEAAKHGWVATSQAWDGPSLTVVYQAEQRPAAPAIAPARPSTETIADLATGLPTTALGIIVGGAMVAVGSFLPWISASTAFASLSRSGIEGGGDGLFTLILGAVVILAGFGTRRRRRSWITAAIAAAIVFAIGFVDIQDIFERIEGLGDTAIGSVGIGLWLVLAGAVVAFVASLAAWSAGRQART